VIRATNFIEDNATIRVG